MTFNAVGRMEPEPTAAIKGDFVVFPAARPPNRRLGRQGMVITRETPPRSETAAVALFPAGGQSDPDRQNEDYRTFSRSQRKGMVRCRTFISQNSSSLTGQSL